MKITKSLFVEFTSLPKLAWFHIHDKETYKKIQEHLYPTNDAINIGQQVEDCVKTLVGDLAEIECKGDFLSVFDKTNELLSQHSTSLYQPRFQYQNLMMRADFLVLNGGKYDLREVKSKNRIRKNTKAAPIEEDLLADVSYQAYVLRKVLWDKFSGRVYFCYLNNNYVRQGELDIAQLIKKEEVSAELRDDEKVETILNEMQSTLEKEKSDFDALYPYDNEDHMVYFGEPAPKGTIWQIPGILKKKKVLYELGKTNIMDLGDAEKEILLSSTWEVGRTLLYVQDYQNWQRRIDKEGIEKKLSQLEYPLYFYDYETVSSPIPLFDGSSSRSQVPMQYSLHKVEKDGTITHKEALVEGVVSDNRAIIEQLYQDLDWAKEGTFIVRNKSFENSRNNEMGKIYPDYQEFFANVNERTFDLMEIFSEGLFFDRDFKGSASIKKVLPVLTDLTYEGMNVPNGSIATDIILKIATGIITGDELKKSREDLLVYCEQDTWAMVRIWQEILKVL